MKRATSAEVLAWLFFAFNFQTQVEAADFAFPGHTLTVPDGFVVEKVAGPPLIDRPIMGDFDERGRLYVADSSGSSEKVDKQLQEKPHRILCLADTDGDGRYDRRTVFADRMMFPEGVMYFEGAVYCGAPPTIWRLEDKDGDGVADWRTAWFEGKTLTGCANDLHGPYLGLDGYIYWCKGAFAKQTHERAGRAPISDSAAHIFRCRADGTDFDSVMSGGMDNPVEIAFTAGGEPIFTTTFFSHPEAGKRDALVHAIYGGVYPKVHGVLEGLTRTGDLLPPLTHLGPAVPCGLLRLEGAGLGEEYRGNLFSTLFNLHKVQRHILAPQGATFSCVNEDFLVSDNPDFHPTDLLEDADGSLLVIDTGGWYKLCCPSSQIAKPEVLGGIYRVRRSGVKACEDPRGLKLAWDEMDGEQLAGLLGDDRPAVRKRALAGLAKVGGMVVAALQKVVQGGEAGKDAGHRVAAVWALTRIEGESARAAVRFALGDSGETVRQAALNSVGLHRDREAVSQLLAVLRSGGAHERRLAAMALGRVGDKRAVPVLLEEAGREHERVYEHSLIYALIEIADAAGTRLGLSSESLFTRRAVLIALDQMPGGGLSAEMVARFMGGEEGALREAAIWIAGLHPEWGGALAGYFAERLSAPVLTESDRVELPKQLGQFTRDGAIQQLLAVKLGEAGQSAGRRLILLGAMGRGSLKEMPVSWRVPLLRCLADGDGAVLGQAVATVRALPLVQASGEEFEAALAGIAREKSWPVHLRLEALGAIPGTGFVLDRATVEFLINHLAADRPPLERSIAANALGRAKLTDDQLLALARVTDGVGPMELGKVLSAFERCSAESVGLGLVEALGRSKGLAALRPDMVKPRLAKFPAIVRGRVDELLASLNQNAAQQAVRLEELTRLLAEGDRDRGHLIFNSAKTACATCHTIGYVGGKVGPDLTRIGSIRTERDLLEAIVYPSASFVRSYEPVLISAKDGEEYSGVLREESGETVVLVSGPTVEQRFGRSEIVEIRPGTVSVMPEGLDQQLTGQELADLVVFLRSLK